MMRSVFIAKQREQPLGCPELWEFRNRSLFRYRFLFRGKKAEDRRSRIRHSFDKAWAVNTAKSF